MKKRIIALILSAMMITSGIPVKAVQSEENIIILEDESEESDEIAVEISDEATDEIAEEVEEGTEEISDVIVEDVIDSEFNEIELEESEEPDLSFDASFSDEWLAERGLTRNSEGLFEYVDENGVLWTYDPEDPEFYKYFVDTERETVDLSENFWDYNIYPEDEGSNSDPFLCPLTGLKYNYPSYYKNKSGDERTKVRYGLDVSKYQGNISLDSWKNMKADYGVDFAFIRAGFRGYGSSGSLNSDATFAGNVKNAYDAGVKVGVYFFSQAITEDEAREEADYCLGLIGDNISLVSLPIMIDYEYAGNPGRLGGANLSPAQHTAIVNAFCKRMRQKGYNAGIYANKSMFNKDMVFSSIEDDSYVWMAHWPSAKDGICTTDFGERLESWQFTDGFTGFGTKGTKYMINETVDLDFWFGLFPGETVEVPKKLSFYANGGSGTMADISGKVGEKVVIPECGFERKFCDFREWNTKADGTGDSYKPGADYVFVDSDNALYAIWECEVTFNPQYGEKPFTEKVLADKLLTQPQDPVLEGYDFAGWYKDKSCVTKWDFDSDIITRHRTLYAKWEQAEDDVEPFIFVDCVDSEAFYTGEPIVFENLKVFFGGHRQKQLTEGKDYSVKYKNNKKVGTASFTVTGKGNFSGSYTEKFEIKPVNLEFNAYARDVCTVYNGKVQKLPTVVTCQLKNGKNVLLKAGTDFTYVYPGTDKNADDYDRRAFVGYEDIDNDYTVKVVGKGNYQGEISFTETILPAGTEMIPVNELSVGKIKNQTLSLDSFGNVIPATPEPVVSYKGQVLDMGNGYWLRYGDNTTVGKGLVFIEGMGIYNGVKCVEFTIDPIPISKVSVENFETGMLFDTKGKIQAGCILKYGDVTLKEGRDYSVTYKNNVNAGKNKATVIFTGKGIFSGSLKKTFTIRPVSLEENQEITIYMDQNVTYSKGGIKPNVEIIYDGDSGSYILKEGVDYSIKADKKASVITVTGKGNFTGKALLSYRIIKANIANTKMSVPDVIYTGNPGNYKGKITLTDSKTGKKLSAGTDYEKAVVYTFIKDGEEVVAGDNTIIPTGTVVTATVKGRGEYYGTISASFRIVSGSISKAKVKVANKTYTGRSVKLDKEKDFISISLGSDPLSKSDFEIVPGSYVNNEECGTAKVTIRGTGKYGGTKVVSFKIVKKSMKN